MAKMKICDEFILSYIHEDVPKKEILVMEHCYVNAVSSGQTVVLKDGRRLGIVITGDSDGFPVFHLHGSGSSRLESLLLTTAALSENIKLIGVDRPGIGLSDYKENYRVLDLPDDIEDAANQLEIDKFAIIGVSAGGPYALACAYKIPHRLTSCGLISTLSPGNLIMESGPLWMRFVWRVAIKHPKLFSKYINITVADKLREKTADENYIKQFSLILANSDKEVLKSPNIRKLLSQIFSESYRQSAKAGRDAAKILPLPWGFDIHDVGFKNISLWHGEKDKMMPVKPAKRLAELLPVCKTRIFRDEGHFSVLANHAIEIFKMLKHD
jgi:pimeloyl-ACP methyl ester carboxylesterase